MCGEPSDVAAAILPALPLLAPGGRLVLTVKVRCVRCFRFS
jgi:hypothetical protein